MWTKLAVLCGALLLVAACESTPEGSADGSSQGATGAPPPPAAASSSSVNQSDVAAVQPAMSLQDQLVQEVGDRVFYDFDKSVVRSDGQATLRRQAAFLLEHNNVTVTIEGHCDERGTREYNLALGDRRANAAKNYLVSLGIAGDRIRVLSYGKERPIVLGHNDSAWAQNRVAITILGS